MNLNSAFYIKQEIEQLETLLSLFVGDETKERELGDKLQSERRRLMRELCEIENFVESIPDTRLRQIARMRYIFNMSLEEIGKKTHYDKSVISRKLKELEKEEICE